MTDSELQSSNIDFNHFAIVLDVTLLGGLIMLTNNFFMAKIFVPSSYAFSVTTGHIFVLVGKEGKKNS